MVAKIIIDTDPGIDDCMAIFFALHSPELEIVGLTSVFGNADIENTSLNCLRILETEGYHHIPVAKGSGQPLLIPTPELGTNVHGVDGMGNTHQALPEGKFLDISAAQFIVETILANPGKISLVPIGPLTNIALALRLEPKIAALVKEVVIMGGAALTPGNVTPLAEANIIHDPHAAEIVLGTDWPLTMVGLDVTTRTIMDKEYLTQLTNMETPATSLIRSILPCYQDYFDTTLDMNGSIHTHDPSAIAYLIAPTLYQTKRLAVQVETDGICMGYTMPDLYQQKPKRPKINVCMDVDAPGVLDLYKKRLTS